MFSPVYSRRVLEPAYRNWRTLYAVDLERIHRAHLVGLQRQGIIGTDLARQLACAIDSLAEDWSAPESVPPDVEDLYFLYEQALAAKVGPEGAAYLHTARSRNDMDTTAFRLVLRSRLAGVAGAALGLLEGLVRRSGQTPAVPIILYTHGQPANVSTLGHYLSAFAEDLADDIGQLLDAVGAVDRSTMGACAITGTGFPLDRDLVSGLLGFETPVTNTYRAISTSHWLVKPAGAIADVMSDLTRLAADMSHKASCEVGVLTFPDNLVQISSIMPQKRNPVILEHIRIQAGMVIGAMDSVRSLYRNVPYQDVNEAADAPVSMLASALDDAISAMELVSEVVASVGVDEDRVMQISRQYSVTSTELADTLVREAGIGFRMAHGMVARFVRSGMRLEALAEDFVAATGRQFPFDQARLESILDPLHFVAVRETAGGPAPGGMAPVLGGLEAAVAEIASRLDAMHERHARAEASLMKAWQALKV